MPGPRRRSPEVMHTAGDACGALLSGLKYIDDRLCRLLVLVDSAEIHNQWELMQRLGKELELELRKIAGDPEPMTPAACADHCDGASP